MHSIHTGIPDFAFNISSFEEDGDTVIVRSHITATHTGPLVLPGMPALPATGKKISLPEEIQSYTFKNGILHQLVTDARPDAGIAGMLAQPGIPLPQ